MEERTTHRKHEGAQEEPVRGLKEAEKKRNTFGARSTPSIFVIVNGQTSCCLASSSRGANENDAAERFAPSRYLEAESPLRLVSNLSAISFYLFISRSVPASPLSCIAWYFEFQLDYLILATRKRLIFASTTDSWPAHDFTRPARDHCSDAWHGTLASNQSFDMFIWRRLSPCCLHCFTFGQSWCNL